MLDRETRTAILKLHAQKHGTRKIARALAVSRNAVKEVIKSGGSEVPRLKRAESLAPHIDLVRQLYQRCDGNRVRVAEELAAAGVAVPYTTLTDFCRRHGIGGKPPERAGRYHFAPGSEMQHDTSPHKVIVGGRQRTVQCASLVLCYSRMLYSQVYERWSRFECRLFLTEALQFFGGSAQQCMIDNSSVVISRGSGATAQVAPQMEALSERFGFRFIAHAVGDANRSGRVERPFHYIEHNFYAGREFSDLSDLNQQLLRWCDQVNGRLKRVLQAKPIELFAAEQSALAPLPLHIGEVYELHHRRVDVEGYISLHRNRYSVATDLIGRMVQVRETRDTVQVFDGPRLSVVHPRQERGLGVRLTLPEHRYCGRRSKAAQAPPPEQKILQTAAPELAQLVRLLKQHHGGRCVRPLRHLHRIYLDYPLQAIVAAVTKAVQYGLVDLARIERMILHQVAGRYFRLPGGPPDKSEIAPDESETIDE